MRKKVLYFSILNSLSLIAVLLVNYLANALPINGYSTAAVSALYPNLFVPADFTFAIWGLIYFMLSLFVGYQWFFTLRGQAQKLTGQRLIGAWFALSALANVLWIYLWHHLHIMASLAVMVFLLFCLIQIYRNLGVGIRKVSHTERFFMHLPFSLYLGWICVALIANTAALLADTGFTGWGFPPEFYSAAMLLLAGLLALIFLYYNVDLFIAIVVAWASFGIFYRHVFELNNQYPVVPATAGAVILLLLVRYLKLRKQAETTRAYW